MPESLSPATAGVATNEPHLLAGKEVSCRAFEHFFRQFRERGGSVEDLCAGVPYAPGHLLDRHARISWTAFCRFLANFARDLDEQELVATGTQLVRSREIRPLAAVGRLLFSCADLYRWNSHGSTSVSRQLFSCVLSTVRDSGPHELEIDTWMHPGYPVCHELFLLLEGALQALPTTLGLGSAEVSRKSRWSGVRFTVRYPAGGGALAGLRRLLGWPFSARTVARELKDLQEIYLLRHAELEREIRERQCAEQALTESNERFFKAFHSTPALMLITSIPEGRFIDVNDSFVNATGYPREELVGRRADEFEFWKEPSVRQEVHAQIQQRGQFKDVQASFLSKSGELRVGLVSGITVLLNRQPCIIWQTADITELKRAEADKLHLEQRMLQNHKVESLGLMAGGIAHDFNNLLVGIVGNADLALVELSPSSPVRRRLEGIQSACQQAAALTQQMLAYAGKGRLRPRRVCLKQLVRDRLILLRSTLPLSLTLDHREPDFSVLVTADASQVAEILTNLVTNAAEACSDGTGTITVVTGTMNATPTYLSRCVLDDDLLPGPYAFIEVQDDASGMDPETLMRIFEPFFTTRFTGRGLGLAATLGIVRRHGGAIRVDSELDRGTTVRVLLPSTAGDQVTAPDSYSREQMTRSERGDQGVLTPSHDAPNT